MPPQDVVILINATEHVTITVPDDLLNVVDEEVRRRQSTRTEVIRDALIHGFGILASNLDNPSAQGEGS